MKLNLGCGSQVPDGWVNVDYALGARLTKLPLFSAVNRRLRLFDLEWNDKIVIHDLTQRFPWSDSSTDVVYSSHTLEHLSRPQGRTFLGECHRVLRERGILRIVVPDLRHFVAEYVEGSRQADRFVEDLGVLYGTSDSKLKTRLLPFIQFPHKCMYDVPRLLEILDATGFDASNRAAFSSDIDDIRLVEMEERTVNAVVVEGRKRRS